MSRSEVANAMQTSKDRLSQHAKIVVFLLCVFIARSPRLGAQTQTDAVRAFRGLSWSTDSTAPQRFIAVHGRRAAIFGYSEGGLEVWTYPVQILSSFSVAFRQQGATTAIDGQTLLRRIIYSPEAVTRIYAGPDFIIREKLFVPLDEPGAIILYETESARPVDIEVRFTAVLDLMWPASIGGQEAIWSSARSAYLLSEPTHRFTASIGSPDIVAHDETPNNTLRVGHAPGLAFTIRADGGHKTARVILAGSEPGHDVSVIAKALLENGASLEKAAVEHYSNLLGHTLQIETPDADTNRALAWSEVALDQAWVCNPDLGCGLVAGYGPSRKARRPQYDWFFSGDGMVAVHALLAAGEYDRARQELEFIFKYQDQKTGMIWHELSQSAGLLDWPKYPYMFVHVDLTFQFLSTVDDYFSATGDQDFIRAHWASIQSAYQYCRSLLDARDGLPRIPADKEGAREQDALSDELTLSASWVSAAQAFAHLAAATGHGAAAPEAIAAGQAAKSAMVKRYWDERQHLWITGYTRTGTPLIHHDIGPARVIDETLLPAAKRNSLLDQLASADFQTDWGTRGQAASASTYDPNSYSSGSVWATGTSETATAFWAEHRPAIALPIWSTLIPWSSLDSLGHMHEALAGDYYHEEQESVPEQTWSSAAFFTAAVNGLLGLHIDGVSNRVTFAPHLPPGWDAITLRNLHVGASEITIHMIQSINDVRLQIQNDGSPVEIAFDPEIPFGAKLEGAQLGSRPITATLQGNSQDTHAEVEFSLPRGNTLLTISYTGGGVAIIPALPQPMIGDPSNAIKITGVNLNNHVYTVDFDYLPSAVSTFELRTPWAIKDAQGATFEAVAPAVYRVTVSAHASEKGLHLYQHGKATLTFASDGPD
jgi:glycogen debranching enzyme